MDTSTPTPTSSKGRQAEAMDDYLAVLHFPAPRTPEAFERIRACMPTIHEEILLRGSQTGHIEIVDSTVSDLTDPANAEPHPEEQHLLPRLAEALQGPFTTLFGSDTARDTWSSPTRTGGSSRLHQIVGLVHNETVIIARGSGDPIALKALLTQLDGRIVTIPALEILTELDRHAIAAAAAARTAERRLQAPALELPSPTRRQAWQQRSQAFQERLRTPIHPTAVALLP